MEGHNAYGFNNAYGFDQLILDARLVQVNATPSRRKIIVLDMTCTALVVTFQTLSLPILKEMSLPKAPADHASSTS